MTLSIEKLPNELIGEIFSYLNKTDLFSCCQVNTIWSLEAIRIIKNTQTLSSNDEIANAIQRFANRISLGECARFRCIIGTGKDYKTIDLEIKASEHPIADIFNQPSPLIFSYFNPTHFDFKENYFANDIGEGYLVNRSFESKSDLFNLTLRQEGMGCLHGTIVDIHGNFLCVTRFPLDGHYDLRSKTLRIINAKFGLLQGQVVRRKIKNCIIITGLALSSLFCSIALYNAAIAISTIAITYLLALRIYAHFKGLSHV